MAGALAQASSRAANPGDGGARYEGGALSLTRPPWAGGGGPAAAAREGRSIKRAPHAV